MCESVMRRTLLGAGALLAAPALAQPARPNRPVPFIVGFAAGGPTDTLPRLAAPGFQEALGQPVVVENRPGAAANLGTEAVIRPTDGHTFDIANSGQVVINPHTYANLPFESRKHAHRKQQSKKWGRMREHPPPMSWDIDLRRAGRLQGGVEARGITPGASA